MSNVFIVGLSTFHDQYSGNQLGKNVVYLIDIDDMRVCHLGDLGHLLSSEQVEEMSTAEVLLLPVGGISTIDAARAAETVRMLEPRLVIPMHYKTEALSRDLAPVDQFLKEIGLREVEPQPKLSMTKSSLPSETRVMVLDYATRSAPKG